MNKRVLVRTLVILGVVALIAGLAFARINASPQRDAGGSDKEASSAPRVTVEPVRATTLTQPSTQPSPSRIALIRSRSAFLSPATTRS